MSSFFLHLSGGTQHRKKKTTVTFPVFYCSLINFLLDKWDVMCYFTFEDWFYVCKNSIQNQQEIKHVQLYIDKQNCSQC